MMAAEGFMPEKQLSAEEIWKLRRVQWPEIKWTEKTEGKS